MITRRAVRAKAIACSMMFLATTGVAPASLAAEDSEASYLIVVNGDAAVDIIADHVETIDGEVHSSVEGAIDLVEVDLSLSQLEDLRQRPGVRWVEQNQVVHLASERDIATSRSDDNWGLDRIDQASPALDRKFRYALTGSGVDVYVIDTGIRRTHAEFGSRVLTGHFVPRVTIGGVDYDITSTEDDCGHGTHVAGIAVGSQYGVASQANVVPVKIFPGGSEYNCDELGTSIAAFVSGINWIIANQRPGIPAVANLSLGVNSPSQTLDDAVKLLADEMPVVVAAGNGGTLTNAAGYVDSANGLSGTTSRSPACTADRLSLSGILTVAATGGITNTTPPSFDGVDKEARYSNHGPCVDIFAPGTDIKSAWPVSGVIDRDGDQNTIDDPDDFTGSYSNSGTHNKSGTSMAAPFVTGAVAMFLQQTPTASPSGVVSYVLANSTVNAVEILPRVGGGVASPNRLLFTCATNCVPSAPRNVTATRVSGTEINVTWEAPEATGGSAITDYVVTAVASGASTATCTSSGSSCVLSGLTVGTSYSITVAARNTPGVGASSTPRTIVAGTAPTAPGAPSVATGVGEVTVSWTAPASNGGIAISQYTVTSSPGEKNCTATGSQLSCTVKGLTAGIKYTFTVRATNDAGSATSSSSPEISPAMEWEFRPAFAAVIPGNKRVDLEWTRAAVRGTAPAGFFTGYRVKDSKGTVVCETTALKCSVRNLVNASKVSFSVEATTIADSSPVGQSKTVIVGGLRQVANAMRRGRSALLTGIATTNSRGKVTWRAVSGGCRISGRILTTPASGSTCRLRVSVAKAGAFPAQTLNVTVRLLA